jgi:hypothetical protein
MKLRDPEGWAATVAANSVPAGWPPEPEEWPPYEEMTSEQRGDAYGAIVIIAAERWAEAMEAELDAVTPSDPMWACGTVYPVAVADIARRTFSAVNGDLGNLGLTGFQYGAAVSILARVWEHGDELRRWHNLDVQLGTEGERANESGAVLNPAILNFGPSEGT